MSLGLGEPGGVGQGLPPQEQADFQLVGLFSHAFGSCALACVQSQHTRACRAAACHHDSVSGPRVACQALARSVIMLEGLDSSFWSVGSPSIGTE